MYDQSGAWHPDGHKGSAQQPTSSSSYTNQTWTQRGPFDNTHTPHIGSPFVFMNTTNPFSSFPNFDNINDRASDGPGLSHDHENHDAWSAESHPAHSSWTHIHTKDVHYGPKNICVERERKVVGRLMRAGRGGTELEFVGRQEEWFRARTRGGGGGEPVRDGWEKDGERGERREGMAGRGDARATTAFPSAPAPAPPPPPPPKSAYSPDGAPIPTPTPTPRQNPSEQVRYAPGPGPTTPYRPQATGRTSAPAQAPAPAPAELKLPPISTAGQYARALEEAKAKAAEAAAAEAAAAAANDRTSHEGGQRESESSVVPGRGTGMRSRKGRGGCKHDITVHVEFR